VADAIHNLSLRKDKPLVKINCAAIPETLLESELFGYEKGAFTGAAVSRKGKFEIANEGTIFFDEIADMPLSLQAKMLRVIEEHNITRLGSNKSIKVNTRVIYATSKDLKKAMMNGEFRDDLYYRINVVPITIPPLRERKEDIPHLINYFLKYFKEKFNRIDLSISQSAFNALLSYSYPGNVRELKHVIERAAILTGGKVIELGDLPDEISSARDKILFNLEDLTLKESIRRAERERILQAINKTGGKKMETAKLLGVGRKTLWKKLKEHGIE
jgi:transcriptional regulator with GAF, ATPase, and Fis domain